jgi:catechol 2,3-dioxygenase
MTALSPSIQTTSIHPATRIGSVHLTVSNLKRQLAFYQQVIGLQLHWQEGSLATLGAGGKDLLHLYEQPGARRYPGTTGIYHFAILLPDRRELARAIGRLFTLRYPNAPTDHILTKTTYLEDPEGNTIELYAESPEDGTWGVNNGTFFTRRADGSPSDGREPLDVQALLRHLSPQDSLDDPMPLQTTIGHVHLYVADLYLSRDFYHNVIGFDVMGVARAFRMGFVSAGGYHHHVGFNTWMGEGAPPPPSGALGLRYFTVVLPDQAELDNVMRRVRQAGLIAQALDGGWLVKDPSQNGVLLTI